MSKNQASLDSEQMDVDSPRVCEMDDDSSDSDDGQALYALAPEQDDAEDQRIEEFFRKTCGCHFGPRGVACCGQFPRDDIVSTRMNCKEMIKAELDLVILANLDAHRRCSDTEGQPRFHIDYFFHGKKVCKTTFMFAHAIGTKHFKNLVTHFNQNGLTPRTHGNSKRLPANTVPLSVSKDIVQFISNFATVHALPLPGRMPGVFSDEKALLVPSSMSKWYVYRQYEQACREKGEIPVGRRKFEMLWCELLPHISAMKPATDLCETCHFNIVKITRACNLPDPQKSQSLRDAEHHLEMAKQERELYNGECFSTAAELKNNPANPGVVHFSFDFAQQIHFPNSPQQIGTLYFLTPRKCQLFGVCCEARGEQVNYLIDENDQPGKGANCVVSMIHHYLELNSSATQEVLLHADNAVGQNKNNTMMQYLCWRIITARNYKIKISFMVPGHTKFAPDRFFGLVKKVYRHTAVSSLPDIEKVISNSSISGKNIPQPTVDSNGKRHVVWYNWSDYLSQFFSTIQGISQYYHFSFDCTSKGMVYVKEHSLGIEKAIEMCDTVSSINICGMPEIIYPSGMSLEQRKYLYEKIRPFCSSVEAAELTCPPVEEEEMCIHPEATEKSSKSQRKCSHCRQPGHTKTVRGVVTCPQLLKENH